MKIIKKKLNNRKNELTIILKKLLNEKRKNYY